MPDIEPVPPVILKLLIFLEKIVTQKTIYRKIESLILRQKARFLIIGTWNTIFGFTLFSFAWEIFGKYGHYLIVAAITNEIATLNSYFFQKIFVFPVSGKKIIIELLWFHSIQALSYLLSLVLIWFCVHHLHFNPILSALIATLLLTIYSYFANKYLSFRKIKVKEIANSSEWEI